MRAETMGDSGKKLEAITAMIADEIHHNERLRKIHSKASALLSSKIKRKKRCILTKLIPRVETKIEKSDSYIRQLKAKKQELFHNLVMQREALGVLDHTWLHEYYDDKNDK